MYVRITVRKRKKGVVQARRNEQFGGLGECGYVEQNQNEMEKVGFE